MKKILPLMIFTLIMVGCGPSQSEINSQILSTSNAKKTVKAATQDAMPTRTPGHTITPDNRSPFEKCRDSRRDVRYVVQVTSGSVSAVSLTIENDTGGTDQGSYKVPYCKTLRNFSPGDFLYISAQIESGSGTIECLIYDDVTLIAKATASGFANIATCSGSAQ